MQDTEHIRNFSIVAHVDHGKSTLADRMLEYTGSVDKRKMKEQVLDAMELERERGITIKMTPVQMHWQPTTNNQQHTTKKSGGLLVVGRESSNSAYTLNLIDTPGHIDFAYEVSRALQAVEGALLLVDATQGVQAQTLSTLHIAQEQGLVIVPVVTKIDSQLARTEEVKQEVAALLDVDTETVHEVSGKTGEGVEELLATIVEKIPPPSFPRNSASSPRALVFDFEYSDHQGAIVYVRVVEGSFARGEKLSLLGAQEAFTALDVGTFNPERVAAEELAEGSIGYIVTGVKKPGLASVGDTVARQRSQVAPLSGYRQPQPVVWASLYPEDADDLDTLRQALLRLRLTDAALSFDEETSGVMGRGFRAGFLGMLHLEIITERLRREFKISIITTTPSVQFEVTTQKDDTYTVHTPVQFPDHGYITLVRERWVKGSIITPGEYLGVVTQLLYEHEGVLGTSETMGTRTRLHFELPLRELYKGLFDELKNVSSGYASLSYEMAEMKEAEVTRLDVLVAGERVPAFSRVVPKHRLQKEAEAVAEGLEEHLPRQQFTTKIQVTALGRIIASRTLKAFRKDVTAGLYGGDITRKRKVLERQKKGKKKLAREGNVDIPAETFQKMMKLH